MGNKANPVYTQKAFVVNEDKATVYVAFRSSTVKASVVEAQVEALKQELKDFSAKIASKIEKVRDGIVVRELTTGELALLGGYTSVDLTTSPEEIESPKEEAAVHETAPSEAPEAPAVPEDQDF